MNNTMRWSLFYVYKRLYVFLFVIFVCWNNEFTWKAITLLYPFFVTTTAYSWSWWLISLPTHSIWNTHTWQNGSIYSMWTQIAPFSLTWMLTLEKSFKPFFVILLDHKMYPKIKFLLNLSSFIWSFQVLNLSFLIWHRKLSALKYVEISDLVSIQIR